MSLALSIHTVAYSAPAASLSLRDVILNNRMIYFKRGSKFVPVKKTKHTPKAVLVSFSLYTVQYVLFKVFFTLNKQVN